MIRSLLTIGFVLILIAACGGDGSDASQASGSDVTVSMFDNRFEFTEIEVPAGGSVTFVGAGRNAHNAVDANGEWSTEEVFGSLEQYDGETARIVFDQPGTYPFYCTFHGNAAGAGMAGVVTVIGG